MQSLLRAEALVIGAGPAGSSLATWLAEQGWDCILVDRARFPRRKRCAGCVSPRCLPFVKRLGLEEEVRTGQRLSFIDVQTPDLSVRFDASKNPLGGDFYVVPRERFDYLLVEKAKSRSVRFLQGVSVERLKRHGQRVVGALAGGFRVDLPGIVPKGECGHHGPCGSVEGVPEEPSSTLP